MLTILTIVTIATIVTIFVGQLQLNCYADKTIFLNKSEHMYNVQRHSPRRDLIWVAQNLVQEK